MIAFIPAIIFWLIAICYLNGAIIHAANILGFSGYAWLDAPLKWQVLDVFYLILNLTVVIGLLMGWRAGLIAFFAAATTQLLLYTALRGWILDVPAHFLKAGADGSLNGLLVFHAVTVMLVFLALWLKSAPATA
ncbi:hypothetical protein [Nitratireductor sp. XY-223]|uniref:hypothetical protein n=1 Tax=Nitratireductor sp. XY-223 TaxID=2561926 RepID=UPI0010AB29A5|nr:hypothetical protein [Nitratireductor sp. XY-223]